MPDTDCPPGPRAHPQGAGPGQGHIRRLGTPGQGSSARTKACSLGSHLPGLCSGWHPWSERLYEPNTHFFASSAEYHFFVRGSHHRTSSQHSCSRNLCAAFHHGNVRTNHHESESQTVAQPHAPSLDLRRRTVWLHERRPQDDYTLPTSVRGVCPQHHARRLRRLFPKHRPTGVPSGDALYPVDQRDDRRRWVDAAGGRDGCPHPSAVAGAAMQQCKQQRQIHAGDSRIRAQPHRVRWAIRWVLQGTCCRHCTGGQRSLRNKHDVDKRSKWLQIDAAIGIMHSATSTASEMATNVTTALAHMPS
jgi:hypothetical protein